MKLSKKQMTIKYSVYCLLILLAEIFQSVNGLFPEINGARCFFLIPVTVILTIDEDPKIAALLGLLAGLAWDCLAVRHMGFNMVFFTIMCYILASCTEFLFRATFWMQLVGAVIANVFYCLCYWLLFMVINPSEGSAESIWYFYVPSMIYTSVMSFIACLVLKPIKRKVGFSKKIEE